MQNPRLHRNIIQRLFGICATKQPSDDGCWTFEDKKVILDLARAPELGNPNGAIRLEKKKGLSERVIVIHGNDRTYHAFSNRCSHAGRRLDPVPGAQQVQCCSIGKSTFEYGGKRVSGSAKRPVNTYTVTLEDDKLMIEVKG